MRLKRCQEEIERGEPEMEELDHQSRLRFQMGASYGAWRVCKSGVQHGAHMLLLNWFIVCCYIGAAALEGGPYLATRFPDSFGL